MKTAQDYVYYLNKPVMVQFAMPYMIPKDAGPVPVKEYQGDDDAKGLEVTYGSPVFQAPTQPGGEEAAVLCLSGMLTRPPFSTEMLLLRTHLNRGDGPMTLEISVDPNHIAYVTMIPTHTPKSRLVT